MWFNNLEEKIHENEANVFVAPTICAWSDLLGFSNVFKE